MSRGGDFQTRVEKIIENVFETIIIYLVSLEA